MYLDEESVIQDKTCAYLISGQICTLLCTRQQPLSFQSGRAHGQARHSSHEADFVGATYMLTQTPHGRSA